MNILLRELKANFKSLLIYSGITILLTIIGFAKFSAYANNPEMLAVLDSMPKALLDAFNFKAFNLTTLSGFYGVMYNYYTLIVGIAAVMWGSDIISKEERDKTVEFSLTLPVKRSEIVTSKTLAVLSNSVVLLLVTWGIVVAVAQPYHPDSTFLAFLNRSMLGLFLLQLIFLSIGIFLGCAMKQYRHSSSAAVSLLLTTYFFSTISGLHEKLEFLKYFSPFKYFDAARLFHEGNFSTTSLLLTAVIIVVCFGGAYYTYARRDLYI